MGNTPGGQRIKFGKTLTEENVSELSALSGFTEEKVREWHAGFLVGIFILIFFYN
jgi:hypothetical protein